MQQISQVSQIFPCQPRTGAPRSKGPCGRRPTAPELHSARPYSDALRGDSPVQSKKARVVVPSLGPSQARRCSPEHEAASPVTDSASEDSRS